MENTNPSTSAAFEAAVDKIRDEMAANPKDGAIDIIGNFLSELLRLNPHQANKITADKKSIKGAMEAMKREAAKNKSGSWGCVDFYTGMKIVLEYYDLPAMEISEINAIFNGRMEQSAAPAPKSAPSTKDEFDIDALLADLEG